MSRITEQHTIEYKVTEKLFKIVLPGEITVIVPAKELDVARQDAEDEYRDRHLTVEFKDQD